MLVLAHAAAEGWWRDQLHHGRWGREGGPTRPAGTAQAALAAPVTPRMPRRLTSHPPTLPGRPMQHSSPCQRCQQGYETVCCQLLWLSGAVAPLPCPACLPVSEPAPCHSVPCKGRSVPITIRHSCRYQCFSCLPSRTSCSSHLLACALRAATYAGSTATSFCAFPQAASTHGMQLQLSGPHTTRAACSSCDATQVGRRSGTDGSDRWPMPRAHLLSQPFLHCTHHIVTCGHL